MPDVGLRNAAAKSLLPGAKEAGTWGKPGLLGRRTAVLTPLFILAPGRSFTSITCAMIGCHPQMFGLAETNLFARDTVGELHEIYRYRARLESGLLRSLAELAFSEQTEETIEAARGWLADNSGLSTAELFCTMQAWAAGRGLVDKSPVHVFSPLALERIQRTIPEARYLHLTRHPADTIKSSFQLNLGTRWSKGRREHFPATDPDAPDKIWLNPHRAIVTFLQEIPPARQMRLKGEDLLSDPAHHLAVIAKWLGIGSGKHDIEAMMHPENSPFATFGPANAPFGNDPHFMESAALRPYTDHPRRFEWEMPDGRIVELNETIRSYAARFGY